MPQYRSSTVLAPPSSSSTIASDRCRCADIGLKERGRRDEVRHAIDHFLDVTAALDLDGLVSDHERTGFVVDVDEKAVGLFRRAEKLFHRRPQRFVVTVHDEHCRRFAAVLGDADDDVPEAGRGRGARDS